MNSVIYLSALRDASLAPCLVLLDLQQGHLAGPRCLGADQTRSVLDNCRAALTHARRSGLPVAYVRQKTRTAFFNPTTPYYDWIAGFEPSAGDLVFEREQPSCYSSQAFASLMESSRGHFVLAGFAGETACLSTAVDAYHRNHRFTYLADASASHALGPVSAGDLHTAVQAIVGLYGETRTTASWIAAVAALTASAGTAQ